MSALPSPADQPPPEGGQPLPDGAQPAPQGDVSDPGGAVPGRPRRLRALLLGVAIAAVLAVVLFVGIGTGRHGNGGSTGTSSGPEVGSMAPNFSLPRLGGGAAVELDKLGAGRHRPVVLNFFASWCSPCVTETPLLAATAKAEKAKGSDIQFIGVDVNDEPSAGLAFARRAGIIYPVGEDRNLHVSSTLYELLGQPDTFFINASGRVVARHLGALNATEMQGYLEQLGSTGK